MRYLARREVGKRVRVYVVDADPAPTEAGIFEPRLGLAAEIPGSPSSLCSAGTYAIADSTAVALRTLHHMEALI